MFRCAKCNEVVEKKEPAMIHYFKSNKERDNFQKQMKPIIKFSKSGKNVFKKDHPEKGKGNVSLCSKCYIHLK